MFVVCVVRSILIRLVISVRLCFLLVLCVQSITGRRCIILFLLRFLLLPFLLILFLRRVLGMCRVFRVMLFPDVLLVSGCLLRMSLLIIMFLVFSSYAFV